LVSNLSAFGIFRIRDVKAGSSYVYEKYAGDLSTGLLLIVLPEPGNVIQHDTLTIIEQH